MAPKAKNIGVSAEDDMEYGDAYSPSEAMHDESVEESTVEQDVAQSRNNNENYRPSEEPLALFEPMLTTDENGNLEFSFTYPQSATTWVMNMMAYTEKLLSDSKTLKVVASRPLMVKCALPRFVRQGDKVTLAATVMNNTDKALENVNITVTLLQQPVKLSPLLMIPFL